MSRRTQVLATDGDIVVERDPSRPSGRLLRQGGMDASYIDLADATHLEFDYMRWLRIVLRTARARRIVHVGGAACALARALAAEDPNGRQDVCEIDEAVLSIAREHLGLRRTPGLRVRHVDGRAFIQVQAPDSYDAVVIDAFVGAAVPGQLITPQAFGEVASVAPLALVNVVDSRSGKHVREIADGLATAYPAVWSIGRPAGNTIVAGGRGTLDLDLIAARLAADRSPARLNRAAINASCSRRSVAPPS